MNSVLEALQDAFGLFLQWFKVLRDPTSSLQQLVDQSMESRLKSAFQVWLVAFIITIIVQLPLLAFLDIEWTNVAFQLSYFTILLLTFLTQGVMVHRALRWFGVDSVFEDTLNTFAVVVTPFSPFFALLTAPSLLRLYLLLRNVRKGVVTLTISGAAAALSPTLAERMYSALMTPILALIGLYLNVLLCNLLISRYTADKSRVFSAVAFAITCLLPVPVFVFSCLSYFVVYAFAK
jgi:hypothetical protein